jgi:hypothetical protein
MPQRKIVFGSACKMGDSSVLPESCPTSIVVRMRKAPTGIAPAIFHNPDPRRPTCCSVRIASHYSNNAAHEIPIFDHKPYGAHLDTTTMRFANSLATW